MLVANLLIMLLLMLLLLVIFVPQLYVQIFFLWVIFDYALKTFCHIDPNHLKTLVFVTAVVLIAKFVQRIYDGTIESFIDGAGLALAPEECGGNISDPEIVPPTHTATNDIWSDPDLLEEQKIRAVLDETREISKHIEDFLEVNRPDERSSTDNRVKNV